MNMQLKNGWKTRMCVCVTWWLPLYPLINIEELKEKRSFHQKSTRVYEWVWVWEKQCAVQLRLPCPATCYWTNCPFYKWLQMTTNDVFFLSVTAFTSTLLLYVHPAYTRFVICVILFCFPFQWSSPRKTAKNRWMGFAHHNRNLTSNSLESAVLFPAKPIDLFHRMFSGRLSSATCWAVAWLCL